MNEQEIYARAVLKWGDELQLQMLVEECSELITAVARWQRGRIDSAAIIEELADVEIMLGQMRILFDGRDIESAKLAKLKRLEDRINKT